MGSQRRDQIIAILRQNSQPVSAVTLAGQLGVSRQIIVSDIALLRAAGAEIFATPRGYLLTQEISSLPARTIACRHSQEETGQELYAIVDNGGSVLDVIVEHPIYGQISGQLHISSRFEVDQFVTKLQELQASPLSLLTGGVHLHTITCPDEACFQRILAALAAAGFLLTEGV